MQPWTEALRKRVFSGSVHAGWSKGGSFSICFWYVTTAQSMPLSLSLSIFNCSATGLWSYTHLIRGGCRILEKGGGGGVRVTVKYKNAAFSCACTRRFFPLFIKFGGPPKGGPPNFI